MDLEVIYLEMEIPIKGNLNKTLLMEMLIYLKKYNL
jgi:hypothetical protein